MPDKDGDNFSVVSPENPAELDAMNDYFDDPELPSHEEVQETIKGKDD